MSTNTVTIACDMKTDLNNAGLINSLLDEGDTDTIETVVDACYQAWAAAAVEIGEAEGVEVTTGRYQPGRFEGDPHLSDEPNGGYSLAGEIWQAAHDRINAEAIIAQLTR